MDRKYSLLFALLPACMLLFSVSNCRQAERDLGQDPFPEAQEELRAVVETIAKDAMAANVEGLQAIHLQSEKFSKFGPRNFARQDVASTNQSEADYFSSLSNLNYEVKDLKIDVFGDIGVVTYYPRVSFMKDGEERTGGGRQTLVLLRTSDGWKIVHEHGTPQFK